MSVYGNITYRLKLLFENGTFIEYNSKNLDCSGSVYRSMMVACNSANVDIINVPKEDRQKLFVPTIFYNRKIIIMQLYLGREGLGEYLVCEKDIYKGETSKRGQNFTTSLQALAGINALAGTYSINLQNVSFREVIKGLAETTGLPVGEVQTKDNGKYNFCHSGKTGVQLLREWQQSFENIDIYVDNNKINAVEKAYYVPINKVWYINEQLKASPQLVDNKIRIQMQLDPRINLNDVVSLTSKTNSSLNGDYRVQVCTHNFTCARFGKSTGETVAELLYIPAP